MDPLYKESAKKFLQNAYGIERAKSASPHKNST